ncbi:basigin related [Holotrichia oblita]|uniref:Basigin related n=1 Tax=Holotrichia oblita TaxID=644536 RepID=A0ACB9T198_HOLOL|nr:basigin related [Holotrichia oblita]
MLASTDSKYLVLPSGELHIKDVGPEDGYKSYQCRTKHRLTGETRLSATKGRLVITEPIGSVKPKFPAVDNLRGFIAGNKRAVTLLCPGQGYPVPTYRYEPMGKVRPNVAKQLPLDNILVGSKLALLCPAQSYPAPIYRTSRYYQTQINNCRQIPRYRILVWRICDTPMSSSSLPGAVTKGELIRSIFALVEPIGLTPPRLPPKSKLDAVSGEAGQTLVLPCDAQSNPVPKFSWLKDGRPLDHSEAILRIESVRKEDKGMYQCFIRNDQESAEASAELKLGGRFDPPLIRQSFGEETLQPGSSVFLKCVAGGNPTPEITWELDGRRLSNNDRYQIGQYVTVNGDVVSHLNVSQIQTNDGGLYRCIASSKVGAVEHAAKINVYGSPYVRPMEKQAIVAGGTLIVHCPVAGYPIESIVWERASYTCVAKSPEGFVAKNTLEVQVMAFARITTANVSVVPPQILPFDFGENPINEGDLASVQCVVTKGAVPIKIGWQFRGELVHNSNGISLMQINPKISSLSIDSVNADHAGNYTCIAENSAGKVSHTAELNVIVVPQISPFNFKESVDSGETVSVQCTVSKGDLPLNITWQLNNRTIEKDDGITVMTMKRFSTLNIDSVQDVHTGEYTCTAQNLAGQAVYSARLNVNVPPQILHFDFGEDSVNEGEGVSIQCTVSKGDYPLNITWTQNSFPINSGKGIVVNRVSKRVSTLSIDSVQANHVGNYTCVAGNKAAVVEYTAVLSVKVPPQIAHFDFGKDSIDAGEGVSTQCTASKGDYPLNITWLLNSKPISPNEGIFINRASKRVSTLIIDNVQANHAGNYTCLVGNMAAVEEYTATLSINVPPHIIPFDFGNDALNAGDSTSLYCTVNKGDNPVNIEWFLNGRPVAGIDGINVDHYKKKVSNLNIESVQAEHSGKYTCRATNWAGSAYYATVLVVNVPPHITPIDIEGSINSGDSVTLYCTVNKGDNPIFIEWFLNSQPVGFINGITVNPVGKKVSVLSIDAVQAEHSGKYTCKATNWAGSAYYTTKLIINVSPHITPFDFGNDDVNVGDSASLMCNVIKGDNPVQIRWFFKQEPIKAKQGVTIGRMGSRASSLTIDSVLAEHSGEYTCMASNLAGSANFSAQLAVNVPPHVTPFDFGGEPLNAGESASAMCTINKGDHPISIEWFLNGRPISHNANGVTFVDLGKKRSVLKIDLVDAEHSGKYTCRATNWAGSAYYTTELLINVPPHITPFDFGVQIPNAGEPVSTMCLVNKGDHPITTQWYVNGKPLESLQGISILNLGKQGSVLSISSVDADHSGKYTCKATNWAGSAYYAAVLAINVPPHIVPFEFTENPVNSGETASVQCTVVKGDTPIQIRWFLNGEDVTNILGITTGKIGKRVSSLTVDNVDASNAGSYTCMATNLAGSANFTTVLSTICDHIIVIHYFTVPPHISPFDFGRSSLNAGQSATVMCTVNAGDYPISIEWFLNGKPIQQIDGISLINLGEQGGVLTIRSVRAEHSGKYTCRATNWAGSAYYVAKLSVNVPPHIPPFFFTEESVNTGDTASVQCTAAKGDIPLQLTWVLNGKPIDKINGISTNRFGKRISTLSVDSVEAYHAGAYTCQAKNKAGSTNYTAHLAVNVPPHISPFDFGRPTLNQGEPVTVVCTAHLGDHPVYIDWFLNSKPIAEIEGVSSINLGKQGSVLTIPSIQAGHSGKYTCKATNWAGSAYYAAKLLVNVPPHISPFDFTEESVNSGDTASVQCTVSKGDIPLQMIWFLNGEPAQNVAGITTNRIGKRISSLSIDSVDASHAGIYTCQARNKAGTANYTADLAVNVTPQITPFTFAQDSMNVGDTGSLTCTIIKGDNPVKINWLHNGRLIKDETGISVMLMGKRISTLTIDSIQAQHSGEYSCLASNLAGSDKFSVNLAVNVPPHITPFDFGRETLNAGVSTSLYCMLNQGDHPVSFDWFLNGKPIKNLQGVLITDFGTKSSILNIDSVQEEHSGRYTCRATNWAGSAMYTAKLIVKVPPHITPFDFGEEALNEGESTSLTCTLNKGDHPITIEWFLDGKPIQTVEGVSVANFGKKTSVLNIDSVQASHNGRYTCRATNWAGAAYFTAKLAVNVPPHISPFDFGTKTKNAGDSISVLCTIDKGDHPIRMEWYLNGKPIYEMYGISVSQFGKKSSILNIDSIKAEHSGKYTCKATNLAGSAYYAAKLAVNVPPQILPFEFGEQQLNTGDIGSATCAVNKGDLPLMISWSLNGQPIRNMEGITINLINRRTSYLSIDHVTAEHSGQFVCHAKNIAGETQYSAVLRVNVPPHISHFDFGSDAKNAGDSASIYCTIDKGDHPVQIEWFLNGKPIFDYDGITIGRFGKKISILSIDSIKEEHSGRYTCKATNFAGSAFYSTGLAINVPPHITPFDFGSDAKNAGESTSLYCTVDKGDHPVQLEWFFNGKPIVDISGVLATQFGRKSSILNIESVHAEHTGKYICKATNWAGSAYYTAQLEVNVPPQILHFDFGNDVVNSGEMAIVNCAVTKGDFPLTISWSLENRTINQLEGISITNTNKRVSQLAIDSVGAQHAGTYTCHAKNPAGSTEYSAVLRVNVAPQVLPFEFGAEEMNSGDTVSVACSVYKGDLPLHITWLLNGKHALDYQGITVNLVNKKLSTLTIDSVDAIHAGQYTCLAKNLAGESSFTKNLTVNVPPQILPFEFGEEQLNTGDMVSATCTVNKGDLPVMISWSLNGQPLPNADGISISSISRRASYLSIDHITAEHSGQFVCHAKNLAGEIQYSAVLRVNVAPHITPFEFEGQSNTGDSVQLTCYVGKGDLPLNISWKLNGVRVSPNDGVSIIPIGGRTSLLTIPAIQPRNAGEYTCYASNTAGSATHTATLYINVQPSIAPFEFGVEAVNSGEMVSVLCTVNKGDFPINITWNLNGRSVGSYSGISIMRTNNRISQLSIDSVQEEHAGIYECVSGNLAGIAKHSAYLKVNGTHTY